MNICSMVYIYPVTLCVFINVYLHAVINKVTLYQCESIIECVSMGWLGDVSCWNQGCWSLPAYGKGLDLLTARLWLFGDFWRRGPVLTHFSCPFMVGIIIICPGQLVHLHDD